MRLGIYMGSFNPPHKAHIKIVNYLLEKNYVDKVLIVPTLGYWDKLNLVDIKHRINMLRIYENDKIIIDDKHNKYIYTLELIKELEKVYPQEELFIIMGADNILQLDKWKNYQELLKYNIIVIPRDGIDINKYMKIYNGDFIIVKGFKSMNISSTNIRNKLFLKYLDKEVLEYINKNHLYQ